MSPAGRSQGEYRSAKRGGDPVGLAAAQACNAESVRATRDPRGGYSAAHPGRTESP